MNFTYDIGFLLPENIRLDTKIAFLCQFVGQLLAIMYCESILAAILDCEVPTNGILCDFYNVILYNISESAHYECIECRTYKFLSADHVSFCHLGPNVTCMIFNY